MPRRHSRRRSQQQRKQRAAGENKRPRRPIAAGTQHRPTVNSVVRIRRSTIVRGECAGLSGNGQIADRREDHAGAAKDAERDFQDDGCGTEPVDHRNEIIRKGRNEEAAQRPGAAAADPSGRSAGKMRRIHAQRRCSCAASAPRPMQPARRGDQHARPTAGSTPIRKTVTACQPAWQASLRC